MPDGASLGVERGVLESHIGYDRGALPLAEALAHETGAPLHRGAYSRLWVDLNRRETNPTVIVEQSYGVAIPGNQGLSPEARAARLATYHRPYRQAVLMEARALLDDAAALLHLSVHAFDPSLPGERDLDVGVLFDPARPRESTRAEALLESLRGQGWDARPNTPYLGTPEGTTSWLREHFEDGRYVGLEIEVSYALDPERRSMLARALARFTAPPSASGA